MKPPSSDLFDLIHSMNKSEKRYFKVYSARHLASDNQYVKLFQLIDNQQVYDEKVLLKDFTRHRSPAQFAVLKKQLYENILESLHRFDEFAHAEQKIHKGIHYCTLLLKKGLFEQCKKQIKKYKQLAYALEKFENIIELIEIEKRLISKTQFTSISYEELDMLQEEQNFCLHQIETTGKFWLKSNTIFKMHYEKKIASGKENTALNDLIQDENFNIATNATTFKSKLDVLQINALHAFVNGNFNKAYQLNSEFLELIDKHKHLKLLFADRYFSALNNYLIDSLILKKFNELSDGIRLMRSLPELTEFRHIQNLEANVFRLSYLLEMNYFVSGEEFERAVNIIPEIKSGIKKYRDKIAIPNIITLSYLCAYTHFCNRNFNDCLNEILSILKIKETENITDIYRDCRMMELICHFEMGDHFLVESQIVSFQRLMLAKKIRSQTIKQVILYIKQYIQRVVKPKKVKLEEELIKLSETECEKALFNNFNYIYWIRNVTMAK